MVSSSYEQGSTASLISQGPGLALIHTLNVAVSMSTFVNFDTASYVGTSSYGIPKPPSGISNLTKINPQLNRNYWVPYYSGSNMTNYEDFQIPFIIKRGDEIRVTWNSTNDLTRPLYETQDFQVTEVTVSGSDTGSIGSGWKIAYNPGTTLNHAVTKNSVYNIIKVTPDPSTFEIPEGKINQFTIRRRTEADDRVIVYQSAPSGSLGFKTLSGQGYLIPNDLSPTQKRNVQTMINQLTAKNQFIDSLDVEPTASI